MLDGEPPYFCEYGERTRAFSMEIMNKALSYEPSDLIPQASSQMQSFLKKLLQFEQLDRPHTAAEATIEYRKSFTSIDAANIKSKPPPSPERNARFNYPPPSAEEKKSADSGYIELKEALQERKEKQAVALIKQSEERDMKRIPSEEKKVLIKNSSTYNKH